MASDKQERERAEKRAQDARDKLAAAQEENADAQSGLQAVVMRDIPEMEVVVSEGNVVSHGDKAYEAGQTVRLEGPTALNLMMAGHVHMKGVAS